MAEINIDTFNSDEWLSLDEKIKQLQENTGGNQNTFSQNNIQKSKELIERYRQLLVAKEANEFNDNLNDWSKIIRDAEEVVGDSLDSY